MKKKFKEFTVGEVCQICTCHPKCCRYTTSGYLTKCPFEINDQCLFDSPFAELEREVKIPDEVFGNSEKLEAE